MRIACLCRPPRYAVKFALPPLSWHYRNRYFSTSPRSNLSQPDESILLGAYTPRAAPNPHAQNIAILGGGITGLASAFNLSRDIPNAKITIYEVKERLGGWIESERLDVDDGKVLFEWGPRTLRSDLRGSGEATVHLV